MRTARLAAAVLVLASAAAWADDPPAKTPPPKDAKAAPPAQEIARLVAQLGDGTAARRDQARKQLETIGPPAVEALTKAAEGHADEDVRAAAKAILAQIEFNATGLMAVFRGNAAAGTTGRINGVVLNADGKRAVSVGWDGVARSWSLENGDLVHEMKGHRSPVMSVALSPDGKRILTGSSDQSMRLWNLESGEEVRTFEGHPNTVWDVAFSPDGKTALSGCSDGTARLWNVETGEKVRDLDAHPGGRAWTVAFTPDGKRAVTGGGNVFERREKTEGTLRLWDLATGKEVRKFEGHAKDVRRVAISPDGRQLLSGSFDGTMRLWDLETGKEVRRFDGPGNFVESVAFTRDGKRAVSCYGPQTAEKVFEEDARCSLRLWDVATGKELRQFKGHAGPVLTLALSGDGRLLMSGSADGTMRLWQLPK